jgi:hypothetical protein
MMTFVVYYGVTVCDCVHLWYLLADEYFKPAIKMSGACKPKLVQAIEVVAQSTTSSLACSPSDSQAQRRCPAGTHH